MYKSLNIKVKCILPFLAVLLTIVLVINNSTSILKLVYPVKYKSYVYNYAAQNGIDPYLVFAIIKAESGFNPSAISRKNARGLMQISEMTGKWGAERLKLKDFEVQKLYNPETNIMIGCWYLDRLMKEFNGDVNLVIIAYNCGSGNLNEWLKDRNLSDSGVSLESIPFKETDKYLKKVIEYHSVYKRLYERDI